MFIYLTLYTYTVYIYIYMRRLGGLVEELDGLHLGVGGLGLRLFNVTSE